MNALDLAMTIYGHPMVRAVLGLFVANILVGIARALYRKDFKLGEVADWLMSRAVPYVIGAGAMQLAIIALPEEWGGVSSAAGWAVWLFVFAAMIGHILGTLRDMGIPVPEMLTDRSKPKVTAGT